MDANINTAADSADLELIRELGRKYAREHSIPSMNLASDYLLASEGQEHLELYAQFAAGLLDEVRAGSITADQQKRRIQIFATLLNGRLHRQA